jgi:hypothetical protein
MPKPSLISPMQGKGMHCHRMIKDVAVEIANAMYDKLCVNNNFYAKYPDREKYVDASWHLFVLEARATLAKLLARPIDESLKESITEALIRDNTLQRGRQNMVQVGDF